MKHILLLLTCSIHLTTCVAQTGKYGSVTNQHLFDTVPFLRQHHDERVARFKNEPVTTGAIVFLGNSITEGGAWQELTGKPTVLNRGIGGDITFGVLQRLDEVVRHKPSKLFILIGINDIAKDLPEAVIAYNCRRIIERIKQESPETTIYLQSILPLNPQYPGFPQHYDKQDRVVKTNRLLHEAANATGANFIDLFPVFSNDNDQLDISLTTDGLHLNKEGYERWAAYLRSLNAF